MFLQQGIKQTKEVQGETNRSYFLVGVRFREYFLGKTLLLSRLLRFQVNFVYTMSKHSRKTKTVSRAKKQSKPNTKSGTRIDVGINIVNASLA